MSSFTASSAKINRSTLKMYNNVFILYLKFFLHINIIVFFRFRSFRFIWNEQLRYEYENLFSLWSTASCVRTRFGLFFFKLSQTVSNNSVTQRFLYGYLLLPDMLYIGQQRLVRATHYNTREKNPRCSPFQTSFICFFLNY